MGPFMVDDDLRHLGQLLWRSRHCLEQIEYLLDVQHLLAEAGMDRWLGRADDQLGAASADLAALDQQRADVLARLADSLGRPGPLSLSDLVEHAPEPWSETFADHLRWFTQQLGRISDATDRARTSLEHGLAGVHELLRSLKGLSGSAYDHGAYDHGAYDHGAYDHTGRSVAVAAGSPLLFDDRA